jgi:ferredoxin
MLANYGYEDGSGNYYIRIDTDKCAGCGAKGCISACPEKLFISELDDFDDEVVVIREDGRNTLATSCALCKANGKASPCLQSCAPAAINFSW